ncbi:MAG: TetR/AcrR family transcriptional regulator [Bacteroidetes bacterium]|nr:TetR/AcrR family transcriptional regulator [Bacteroidota bacterium]
MSHKERRLREKEKIRQSIIKAARKIAVHEGWHSVTIRKIADAIEYTPPVVYEYFESKEDIFKEIIYYGFNIVHKEIEKAKHLENDPKKLLLNISLIYWDFAENNMDLFQLMFSLERPAPNKKMINIFKLMENIFMKLAKNNKSLCQELLVNWICLHHGAISIILRLPPPPHFIKKDKRENYISIMKRFIGNI